MTRHTSSRRQFVSAFAKPCLITAAGLAGPALHAKKLGVRIGVTDWSLRQTRKIEAIALAAKLGFEGVEVSLGNKPDPAKLRLADPEPLAQYIAEAKKHGSAGGVVSPMILPAYTRKE